MARYTSIDMIVTAASAATAPQVFATQVIPRLVDIWLASSAGLSDDVVETTSADFAYLFDIGKERLIAAWGISRGRFGGDRDAPRMKQFPLSAGAKYHRGHAIPHRLGGPLDINLVPQLGAINIGPFRALEKRAMATPGALYFTFWTYRGASQTPVGVIRACSSPVRHQRSRHSVIEAPEIKKLRAREIGCGTGSAVPPLPISTSRRIR